MTFSPFGALADVGSVINSAGFSQYCVRFLALSITPSTVLERSSSCDSQSSRESRALIVGRAIVVK